MTNTPNRYTLILLKDYANLSQVKISPFTFWLLITLFTSAFLFCFIAIVISGFIWQNSNAIKLERDALYKQFVAAQVKINRLTALENIVYNKNIRVATVHKRSDVEGKHNILLTQNSINLPQQENSVAIPPSVSQKEVVAVAPVEKVKEQGVAKESKQKSLQKNQKELFSKVVALQNIKANLQNNAITLGMDIVNTSKSKQDGSIIYTAITKDGEHILIPNNRKKNSSYAINKGKYVETTLSLPQGITKHMVIALKIELVNNNSPIVRIVEKL